MGEDFPGIRQNFEPPESGGSTIVRGLIAAARLISGDPAAGIAEQFEKESGGASIPPLRGEKMAGLFPNLAADQLCKLAGRIVERRRGIN